MADEVSQKLLADLISHYLWKDNFVIPRKPLVRPTSANVPPKRKSPLLYDERGYTRKLNPMRIRTLKARIGKEVRQISVRVRRLESGRTFPSLDGLAMSQGKDINAAIMFFDLVDSKRKISKLPPTQQLFVLNLILFSTSLIIKSWNGKIEKNTGDGLMAIFDAPKGPINRIIQNAIESAVAIKHLMVLTINPEIAARKLPVQSFRIGIEAGSTLISKIGIQSYNFVTAIGHVPARANQLQELALPDGICISEFVYNYLHPELKSRCEIGVSEKWQWRYPSTQKAYNFYHFDDSL